MKTTPILDISADAFGAWLRGFAPQRYVGRAYTACGCPIAVYIAASIPHVGSVNVEERMVSIRYFGETRFTEYALPLWAQAFIDGVDMFGFETSVTAGAAIEVLGRVMALEGVAA